MIRNTQKLPECMRVKQHAPSYFVYWVHVVCFLLLAWCALRAHSSKLRENEHKTINARWRKVDVVPGHS